MSTAALGWTMLRSVDQQLDSQAAASCPQQSAQRVPCTIFPVQQACKVGCAERQALLSMGVLISWQRLEPRSAPPSSKAD